MAEMSIRELREELGLTQREFADALAAESGQSVARPTVTGWENGHSRPVVNVARAMVRLAERAYIHEFTLENALPENGKK